MSKLTNSPILTSPSLHVVATHPRLVHVALRNRRQLLFDESSVEVVVATISSLLLCMCLLNVRYPSAFASVFVGSLVHSLAKDWHLGRLPLSNHTPRLKNHFESITARLSICVSPHFIIVSLLLFLCALFLLVQITRQSPIRWKENTLSICIPSRSHALVFITLHSVFHLMNY